MLEKLSKFIKNTDERKFRERFLIAIFIDFVFSFSIFTFIPYETYFGNVIEFNFTLNEFWTPLWVTGILFALVLVIHLFLKGFLFDIYTSIIFGITVAGYVQSMFLNGMMHKLDGTEVGWSTKDCLINLLIWGVIILISIIGATLKNRIWRSVCNFGALIILGAQAAALVSLLITFQEPVKEIKISDKGLYEISGGNNVVVFCLDKFDQTYIDMMLEKYPNAMDHMNGFTYYPNATGKYCYTHIAVPYLLTGNTIPEYNPTEEQYNNQIETSDYFNYLADNIGNLGIYTSEFCVRSEDARSKIDNFITLDYSIIQSDMAKACIKSSMYRVMPFLLKPYFEYSSSDFNHALEEKGNVRAYNNDTHATEALMLETIQQQGLKINDEYGDSAFRFIHVNGTHEIFRLDENGNYVGDDSVTSVEQCAAGVFKLIEDYCDELDRLGLFEDATIIITADHGKAYVLQTDSPNERNVNPIFFYKPAGVPRKDELKTSMAPVAHDDIFATVLNAYGKDGSSYGYSIDEVTEEMDRTRYFYWCSQDPEITEYESCIHIEYAINGDARDNNNWKETGVYIYPNYNPRHK